MGNYNRGQENRQGAHTADPLTLAEEQFIIPSVSLELQGRLETPRRSSERNPQETTKPARLPQNSCCRSRFTDGIIFTPGKLKTHHPEECCLRQGLVLVDGGEDAEDQTGQNHEEPAGRRTQQTLTLIH